MKKGRKLPLISLQVIFWIFVVIFAVIGAVRGWAREVLVIFSSVLGIFILFLLENYADLAKEGALFTNPTSHFWLQAVIFCALVFFGYQSPNLPALAGHVRFINQSVIDNLAGLFLGAINGYFIFGSLWFFMDAAGYPFSIISAPGAGTEIGDAAINMLAYLPPHWLVSPAIYFSAALALALVLVVFL
jgi:uncharacterized membrane protein required for colicin V production